MRVSHHVKGVFPTVLFGLLLLALPAVAAQDNTADPPADTSTEYRLRARPIPKESIFDITFGSPPPMATERGILIIDAYLDRNGNLKRDQDETDLTNEITCRVGEVDYAVPAFVPGLSYNETYAIACRGQNYQPQYDEPDVFVGKRGQVITVDLPCRPLDSGSANPPGQSPPRQP